MKERRSIGPVLVVFVLGMIGVGRGLGEGEVVWVGRGGRLLGGGGRVGFLLLSLTFVLELKRKKEVKTRQLDVTKVRDERRCANPDLNMTRRPGKME
jgi:hypothetical protein